MKGSTVELQGELAIIFKTGAESYSLMKPEFAQLLAEEPLIDCPPGLKARIVSIDVKESPIDVIVGVGKGYRIPCRLEIAAGDDVGPGDHAVIVALPAVSQVAQLMKATSPTATPTYRFNVKVYASEQARQDAKAAEIRARQEAAAAERRAIEAKEAEEERQRWQRNVLIGVVVSSAVILYLICLYVGPWLFPKYQIEVGRGRSSSIKGSLTQKAPIDKSKLEENPEPFSGAYSARSFWGAKTPVRVDIVAISADRTINEITTTTYRDGTVVGTSISYEAITNYQVRITASAGWQASPMSCLARTPAGSVRVKVV